MNLLSGKVAVVTGASRGIGKGIALALAAQGATVYVTGRTVTRDSNPLPGTVGETAAECDRRGGKGIAVQVDHANDEQVAALFEQVKREQGRLDILVNNAFALPQDLTDPNPFWEKPLSNWEMVDVGVRSNFVVAWHAAKIMVPQKSGLIVAMISGLKNGAATRPENGCSPEFPGLVIAALSNDADAIKHSGGTFITAELAQHYNLTDIDGRTIPSLRSTRGAPIWSPV